MSQNSTVCSVSISSDCISTVHFENVRTAFTAFCNENITRFHVKNDMYLTKPKSGFAVLKT